MNEYLIRKKIIRQKRVLVGVLIKKGKIFGSRRFIAKMCKEGGGPNGNALASANAAQILEAENTYNQHIRK